MSDSSSESRKSRKSYWPWIALLVLLAVGGYWFFNKQQAPAPASGRGGLFGGGGMASMPVPVKIATAQVGPVRYTLKAIGTVTAFKTVTVRSRVDGELQKIAFEEGQKVEAGDLLAQIDPRTYQNALNEALGQQKQNEAQLANAQRDLQRYQLLYKQNSIAKQQVDAQAALVQQLQGSRTSDQAAVDSAKLQLEFTRITAPISGRLGLRKVDEGNMVNASNTDGLVTITQTQPISVLFTLPQAQLPDVLARLRTGKKLTVDLYDRDNLQKIAVGELASVDNQIDVATGTVSLKARFQNEDETLFPNQFANVRLHVDTAQALVVPTAAVQHGSIGAFVYLLDDEDKVHVQAVTVGRIDEKLITIASGLTEGQRVVIEGVDRLREGAKVEIVQPEANNEAADTTDSSPVSGPGSAAAQDAGHPH